MSEQSVDLVRQGRAGVLSNVSGMLVVRIVRTGTFILLARMLTPADFGLVALAAVITSFAGLLVTAGLTDYLIRVRELRRELVDSAFLFSITVGASLTVLLFVLAPVLGQALGDPRLTPVLRGLAPLFVISGLFSVPQALTVRALRFARLNVAYAVGALISSVAALTVVLLGFGVWGLVAQVLVEALCSGLLIWRAAGLRPGRAWSRAALAEMLSFGGRLLAGNYLSMANTRADNLLVGVFLGPSALGIYSVAYKFLEQVQDILLTSFRNVLLPIFARLSSEPARLRQAWSKVMSLQLLVVVPLFAVAALSADPLVQVLFGAKWAQAAPIMAVLALSGPLAAFSGSSTVAANAEGRVGASLRFAMVSTVLILGGFATALLLGGGILAMAVSYVLARAVLAPLSLRMMRGDYTPSAGELWRVLRPVALGSGVSIAVGALVAWAVRDAHPLLRIVTVGATVMLLQALISGASRAVRADVRSVLRRGAPTLAPSAG